MNERGTVKLLKTAVGVSKILEVLCTFSTAITTVTAIWAIYSTARKLHSR